MAIDMTYAAHGEGDARGTGRVIALASRKGGVGKTTTAVHLATSLAATGLRVAVVDLDDQANATEWLRDPSAPRGALEAAKRRLEEVLVAPDGADPAPLALLKTHREGVFLVPGSPETLDADASSGVSGTGHGQLARALEAVRGEVDVALLDVPGQLGRRADMALFAADGVIVPTRPAAMDLAGVAGFYERMLGRQIELGRPADALIEVVGVLLGQVEARTVLAREVYRQLGGLFGAERFDASISKSVRYNELYATGEVIGDVDKKLGRQWAKLAKEVRERAECLWPEWSRALAV